MNWLKDSRKEVLGGALVNVAVLLLTAGAISDVFTTFKPWTKAAVLVGGVALLAVGVMTSPNKDNKEDN